MNKKYEIIYADPPWDYGARCKIGMAFDHFPCFSLKKLKKLPIQRLAAKNCLLFLWVVNSKLEDALKLAVVWKFRFITVGFVWQKPNRVLCGNYTMSSTEQCLIFKQGCIPLPRGTRNERQFLSKDASHIRCEKPDEIRKRITRMFPTQNKLELFATQTVEGWDCWGNEIISDINLFNDSSTQ